MLIREHSILIVVALAIVVVGAAVDWLAILPIVSVKSIASFKTIIVT